VTEHRLQPGIYFDQGATPHPYYRLLLVNAVRAAERASVADALKRVVNMLKELSLGRVRDLSDQPREQLEASADQFRGLDTLVGYGRRFFDRREHLPPVTEADRPDFLTYLASEHPFPAIPWARQRRNAEADFALQLTGLSEAAVSCAAVEVWKLIEEEGLPLVVIESLAGYGRADGRGWLGFHDGVSNMASDQRLEALVAAADPPWMDGGTYMAYLRILVDLIAWSSLTRDQQELLVGRDKMTGAALVGVQRESGRAIPIAGPAPGKNASTAEAAAWRDPPQTTDPLLEASHIARANQSRASPTAPGALRIYRQGYDFLESVTADGLNLGLNFVSFQRDLRVLQQLLHLPGWLGDANFGGATDQPPLRLLSIVAGGFYAVPPRAEPFAGASLFLAEGRSGSLASRAAAACETDAIH
jgi:Dyp-type peroxidase family